METETEKELSLIWNKAVSEVGSNKNTYRNFLAVMERFNELCKAKGTLFSKDVKEHILNNYKAVCWHFEQD